MAVNPLEPVAAPVAPAPGQPAAPASVTPNALFEKAGGDWNKAGQSYFHAVGKIGELHAANEQKDATIRQLQSMIAGAAGVGQPAADANPLQRLNTEFGIPIEPFEQAIQQTTLSTVNKVLSELLGPVVRDMEANETLSAQVENFDQLKGSARKFMADPANQEVLDTFNAVRQNNPAAAWKYAIQTATAAATAAPTPSPHLGLPGGVTPQGRAPVNPAGPSQPSREGEALEYGRQYGDMGAYTHERLKGTSVERHIAQILQSLGMTPQGW